ncbi:hypothetical protein A1O1_01806 [Capronia coronata CBS 617.96]|uniref:Stress-response A/B barrel domain-containing protein n=1 Tax=Capronia coronata CBS 617.96 TaxID=1182541 RepID=W9ZG02_9EURO|nr:uncharacterized protein A1O1_01806 [Capronia coronata CBS 617.96]EXJ93414.1 hypothetical protein A1O1_01806 [Capronia coronata CBS 617.96]
MGGIIHVVQLQFKPDADPKKIEEILGQLKALKDKCIHPTTKAPYIKSITAGVDNSIEGLQNGYTHMIITVFESVEDRNYYAKSDPAHLAVGAALVPLVKGLQVLDIDA